MDVVSFCALRVSSLLWQPHRGAHALTVICKATFALKPGESPLAATQEAVWDATAPANDMMPFKRRADVFVVGHAYPPEPQTAEAPVSLVARLGVGSLQKAIEVRADRGWVAEGLEPLSPTSPARMALLGRHAALWDHRAWNTSPVPEDMDGAFFNVAPRDQQLAELIGDERLVLEHLHPSHRRLDTRLAPVAPRATVQRTGGQAHDVRLRCDTLSIDTDRQIAMLVWRGVVVLAHAAEEGLVAVVRDGAMRRVGDDVEGTQTLMTPFELDVARRPVLPFVPERMDAGARRMAVPFDVPPPALVGLAAHGEPSMAEPPRPGPPSASAGPIHATPVVEEPLAPSASSAPAAPSAPEPVATWLTLEQYATLAAELDEAKVDRAKSLEALGLEEASWRANDRRWKAALDEEAGQGQRALRETYDAAYVARVERSRGPITLEEYALLVAGLERGKANPTLDALSLQRAALMPVVRHWTNKVTTDMTMADRAPNALRAARKLLGGRLSDGFRAR